MDFILESYAMDNPNVKFIRSDEEKAKENRVEILRQWSDRMLGRTKDSLSSKFRFKLPSQYQPIKPPQIKNTR